MTTDIPVEQKRFIPFYDGEISTVSEETFSMATACRTSIFVLSSFGEHGNEVAESP